MTILLWRILCLISAVFFVAGVIVLLVTNFTKNKYYQNYHEKGAFHQFGKQHISHFGRNKALYKEVRCVQVGV